MATYSQVRNHTVVPVVDRDGNPIGEERIFVNIPLTHFYDDPFVIIHWLLEGKKPDVSAVESAVTVEGVEYHGGLGWGSMVKKGQTIGVVRDYGSDIFRFVRDGVRLKRWLFAEGRYGAVACNDLKVKVMDEGTVLNGLPVEDGFGYISRSAAETLDNGHVKISARGARESFQFWSRLPWAAIAGEVTPYLMEDLLELADPLNFAFNANSPGLDEKKGLCAAEPLMNFHPFIANAFGRDAADMYRRAAGTVRTNAKWKIAAPALVEKAAISEESVMYRYPIDSNASMQVAEADTSAEAQRIEGMEIVQFSLSGMGFLASGCLGVVDDELLDGADIVLCAENIKLATDLKDAKSPGLKVLDSVVLTAIQWYEAGSGMGLNAKWWKKMGGDFDGDLITYFTVKQEERSFEAVAQAIREMPQASTLKLRKSMLPLTQGDRRAEMVVNNMNNIVGFASNLAETTFMVADRKELARRLGYQSIAALDAELNFLIKAGTDGFKSFVIYNRVGKAVTMDELEKACGRLQSNMITVLGMMAPETGWARSDWAFRRSVPACVRDGESPPKDKDRAKLAVYDWMGGTVQEIAKIALPNIAAAIGTPIESKPLSFYRVWSGKIEDDLYKMVHELQMRFNARVHRINFNWSDQVESFKTWWREEIDSFCQAHGVDRWLCARALWNVSHGTRSTGSGAGSVFMGMPAEAERIIREKPGLEAMQSGHKVVMTGLLYNIASGPTEEWTGLIEVGTHSEAKNGRVVHRTVVFPAGDHPFTFQPKDNGWPEDMLGVVSIEKDQLEEGFYDAKFKRRTERSWDLTLS